MKAKRPGNSDLLHAAEFALKEFLHYDGANEPGSAMDKSRKKAMRLLAAAIKKAKEAKFLRRGK